MNLSSPSNHSYPDALPAGTMLRGGDLTLEGVLGQGGFGITYRATDNGLHRTAAVKEFFPEGSRRAGKDVHSSGHSDSEFDAARARFLQEARTLAQFRHPHIVNVYTIFEENNSAYMVMEFVDGHTLSGLVESRGALPLSVALSVIRQVGDALEAVHRASLLHLDVKPDNVIVNEEAEPLRAVLLDFGLTRKLESATGYGTTRLDAFSRFGTAGYAPPEQYSRTAQPGVPADVYALAATAYFLLTGEVPPDSVDRASGSSLADPRSFNREIPATIADAFTKGMALDPQLRPQGVRAFLDQLDSPAAANQSTPKADSTSVLMPRSLPRDKDPHDEDVLDQLFGSHDPFSRPPAPRRQAPRPSPFPQRQAPRRHDPFGRMPFPGVHVSGCGCGPCCLSIFIILFFFLSFLGALLNG